MADLTDMEKGELFSRAKWESINKRSDGDEPGRTETYQTELFRRIDAAETLLEQLVAIKRAGRDYLRAVAELGRIRSGGKSYFEGNAITDPACGEAWFELDRAGKALAGLVDMPSPTRDKDQSKS